MIPPFLLRHTASVEPYLGAGTFGDEYGPAIPLPCYAEQQNKIVRTDTGEEAVSTAQVYCDPGDDIPEGSRVTVLGRTSIVLSVTVMDTAGLVGIDHREVALA